MCTAIAYRPAECYFGRTLDFEHSFGEQIVITPREYPLRFCFLPTMHRHYALLGMAKVIDETPLYFDAVNEAGLAIAGLLFDQNAVYFSPHHGTDCLPPFELTPYLLGTCKTVAEAVSLLKNITIVDVPFRTDLPNSPLHWMLTDAERSIVIESTETGLTVFENPVEVLTNNPPFPMQLFHLRRFLNLTPDEPENRFSKAFALQTESRGMGAVGLPGDFSSPSRFVRAAFVREHAVCGQSEAEGVNQFFHILDAVSLPRGAVRIKGGAPDLTQYAACTNLKKGIYYYKTYENSQITAVGFTKQNKTGTALCRFGLRTVPEMYYENCEL